MSKYNFTNFYMNANNKQAFFAASEVGHNPGRCANPLYIYGSSQTGKTHILYSIEHYIHEQFQDMIVVHSNTSTFCQECIDAIRSVNYASMSEFRSKYKNADILLFDDIHRHK